MNHRTAWPTLGLIALVVIAPSVDAAPVEIRTEMAPPYWALLERQLIAANERAGKEFFEKYFDERGFLLCIERWGGDDGPDDAIETLIYWPILHVAGASDSILHMYKKAWEGHLRQYTLAKTVNVPFARDGMYYKEFPVMMDWLHNGEGLVVFGLQGLSDPYDIDFQKRARRYAGFYLNEDPQAPNYDPKHKIIRSLFSGSRGPLLRKATGLDWAGDPIEVVGRFKLGHGEENYAQMIEHFKDYNDIVGDHPSNLLATALAFNAYTISHEQKYKDWVLEYVGAWRDRMIENGDLIPSNIGLDGTIGGETDGKWYGGVYGWGFTVAVPQTGELDDRQTFDRGIHGFTNAVLLTGDLSWLDPWRRQLDKVNSNKKVVDGKTLYPYKYGDDGWYSYKPEPYRAGAGDMYYMTMREDDRRRAGSSPWFDYLEGKNPGYPEQILKADFAFVRSRVAKVRADETTPDTRLSDDPLQNATAAARSLTELMMGGLYPGRTGMVLHCRLRYFDPIKRRAGVPQDVAALVDKMTADDVAVTLVNLNQSDARTLVVQAGAYAEHEFVELTDGSGRRRIDAPHFTVKLEPGAGGRLQIKMRRYVHQPTITFPWDRH